MGPRDPGGTIAELALIIVPLPNPLQVHHRPPMACANLRRCAGQHIPRFVQTGLLGGRWWDLLGPVMGGIVMPGLLRHFESL